MEREPWLLVVDAATGETLPGIPSLYLASEGRGEAWQQHPPIWRLREPSDPPGTAYRRVRFVRNPAAA